MQKKRLAVQLFFTFLAALAIIVLNVNRGFLRLPPKFTPSQTSSPIPAESGSPTPEASPEATPDPVDPEPSTHPEEDYLKYLPNEAGDIPIIMFHRMLEAYEPNTEKDYTTTFAEFEALLQTLYDQGYRLISMKDFINCDISVPAGTRPMVFTFDDGTPSQFNLIGEPGSYSVNPRSAVGIMMAFHEKHPDFGLKGIFYVNMDIGDNAFSGSGTVSERFEVLQSMGFEIGSHTWGHVDFKKLTTPEAIQECLGKNQKKASEEVPGLQFYSLALPFGSVPKAESLMPYLTRGNYEDIAYENLSIMAVGANPSAPSIRKDYNAQYVRRIRAQGRIAVDGDLTWWLPKMTAGRMFISDGNPKTITVPAGKAETVDTGKLGGKELVTY